MLLSGMSPKYLLTVKSADKLFIKQKHDFLDCRWRTQNLSGNAYNGASLATFKRDLSISSTWVRFASTYAFTLIFFRGFADGVRIVRGTPMQMSCLAPWWKENLHFPILMRHPRYRSGSAPSDLVVKTLWNKAGLSHYTSHAPNRSS